MRVREIEKEREREREREREGERSVCVTHAVCVWSYMLIQVPWYYYYFRYVVEPDVMDPDHTLVVEIPVR